MVMQFLVGSMFLDWPLYQQAIRNRRISSDFKILHGKQKETIFGKDFWISSFVKAVLWSYQKMRKIRTSSSLSLTQPGSGPFPHWTRKRETAIRKWLSKSTKPPRSQWTVQRCRWCGPTQKAFVVFWVYLMASEAPKVHEEGEEVYIYNCMYYISMSIYTLW